MGILISPALKMVWLNEGLGGKPSMWSPGVIGGLLLAAIVASLVRERRDVALARMRHGRRGGWPCDASVTSPPSGARRLPLQLRAPRRITRGFRMLLTWL
ncbi:MAG: hypothetical protein U0P30_17190 [Vicinamibacterales bacterium]